MLDFAALPTTILELLPAGTFGGGCLVAGYFIKGYVSRLNKRDDVGITVLQESTRLVNNVLEDNSQLRREMRTLHDEQQRERAECDRKLSVMAKTIETMRTEVARMDERMGLAVPAPIERRKSRRRSDQPAPEPAPTMGPATTIVALTTVTQGESQP